MRQSNYYEGRIEEHPVQKARCRDAVYRASEPDARELLGLELHVCDLLAMNLLANRAKDDRCGRLAQCWIVNLGDNLGCDEDTDRDLQTAEQVSRPPEDSIGAAALDARDSIDLHEAAEHAGVALFFDNQHPDRLRINGVAGAIGPFFRVAHQVSPLRVLAELEHLDRMSDCSAF